MEGGVIEMAKGRMSAATVIDTAAGHAPPLMIVAIHAMNAATVTILGTIGGGGEAEAGHLHHIIVEMSALLPTVETTQAVADSGIATKGGTVETGSRQKEVMLAIAIITATAMTGGVHHGGAISPPSHPGLACLKMIVLGGWHSK